MIQTKGKKLKITKMATSRPLTQTSEEESQSDIEFEDEEEEEDGGWGYKTPDPMAYKSPFASKTIVLTPMLGCRHEITSTQVVDRLVEIGINIRNNLDEVQKIAGKFRLGFFNKLAEQHIRQQIIDRMSQYKQGYIQIGEIRFEMEQKAQPKKRAELLVTQVPIRDTTRGRGSNHHK